MASPLPANRPQTLQIRTAQPGDAERIAQIHVETWRSTYAGLVPDDYLVRMTETGQAFQWRKALRRPGQVLVAVTDDVGVVGFGSSGRSRYRKLPYAGEVYTLYVAEDFQNRGIGRALLTGLFRAEVAAGRRSAVIWVLTGNPSRFFYSVMGGEPVAEQRERFAGAELDETAYGWPDLDAWLAAHTGIDGPGEGGPGEGGPGENGGGA